MKNLGFEARRGGLLRAGAFVEAGQVRAQYGILFADRMDLRLQSVEFAASDLHRFFLIEAGLFLLRDQRLIALALGAGLFVLTREALQFQASRRKPRTGAGVFLGKFALFVIQRERVLLLRLLKCANLLQFFRQERRAALQGFEFGGQLIGFAIANFNLSR